MSRRRRSREREEADEAFEPSIEGATFRPPFISPWDTGRWAIGLLLITIALAWISVGIDLSNLSQTFQATRGERVPPDLRMAQFTTEAWLLLAQLATLLCTGFAFIAWLYQTRVNLRALGVRRPSYGRKWCILGFLIPGMNFFRPFQVMREVWQASSPGNLDAFTWRDQQPPPLLILWWVSFVGSLALRLLSLITSLGSGFSLPRIQLTISVLTLSDLAAGISAGLACYVVTRLSETQEEKWELLSGDAPSA